MRKTSRMPLEELRPYMLEIEGTLGPPERLAVAAARLDWQAIFGNDRPVEMEVGFGKGLFLRTTGETHPEVNYAGIEIVRKYQLFAATRLAKARLSNVRVACADARVVLQDRVPPGSVQAIHVYFPDPWWKNRHHKRRVFTETFAQACEQALRPGGALLVVTDVADYAAMVRETTHTHTQLRDAPPPVEHTPTHDMDYLTNFERKFRQEGRTIHRMRFEKA